MSSLDNVWQMYMGLKDRRRQKERDDVADSRYADAQEQQSLANSQRERQLGNVDRAWEAGQQGRADKKILDQQAIDANILSIDENQHAQLAKRTQQLVYKAGKNGAEALFADPTERPIIHRLISDALDSGEFIPDGYKFSGFEEISGPATKDGAGANLFVPMVEDAEGNKMDIGQLLAGKGAGASAFTADQLVSFLENTGQAYEGTTTSMGMETLATPSQANAGESVIPQQQTQQVETPAVETPVVETTPPQSLSGTPDNVTTTGLADAEVTFEGDERIAKFISDAAIQHGTLRTKDGLGGMGANKRLSMTQQIEDVLLDDVMSATGLNHEQASNLITQHRNFDSGEDPAARNRDITAKNFGKDTKKVVDAVGNALGTVGDALSFAPKYVSETVSDIYTGFTEPDAETKTGTETPATNVTTSSSANTKALGKQEQQLKETPPTTEETATVSSDAIDDARQMQQAGEQKRPTQKQRNARARRISIRRSNGETISAEQADRYINTGFIEKGKIDNVTVGQFDYERGITPEGFVTYKRLGASGAAIRGANSANAAEIKANDAKREPIFEAMAVSALGRAAIEVVDDKGAAVTNIGPFHTRKDFGIAAMRFIDNNAASLAPYLDFDPTIPNPDLGQQRLLEGVMTAYASSLDRSKSGEQIFSNTNDFSKFIKSYSAKSGLYIINNRMVNLDDRVNEQVKNLGGDPARIKETVRAMLAEQQGPL